MSDAVLVAIISGFSTIIVAMVGVVIHKAKQIHVLANSRLTEALTKIENLERALGVAETETIERRAALPASTRTLKES
jgi:hypothetical protein